MRVVLPFYLPMVRRVPSEDTGKVAHSRGVQVQHAARIRGGHRESARSGDADGDEGATVDSDEPVSRVHTNNGIMGYRNTEYKGYNVRETPSWEVVYGIQIRDHGTMGYGIKCVGYRRRDIMEYGKWNTRYGIRDAGYGIRDAGYGIRDSGIRDGTSWETGCRYGVQGTGSWDNGIPDKMRDTGEGIRGQ